MILNTNAEKLKKLIIAFHNSNFTLLRIHILIKAHFKIKIELGYNVKILPFSKETLCNTQRKS